MGKFFVRITIIAVATYTLLGYLIAQIYGVNIHSDIYVSAFEFIAVIYCYSEGKYHCRYIKWLALALFLSDSISRIDYAFNFLSANAANLIPIGIFATSIFIMLYQAIRHFYQVSRLKRLKNGRE